MLYLNPSTNRQQNGDGETTLLQSDVEIVEVSDHRTAFSNQIPPQKVQANALDAPDLADLAT